jgi:hypothetical protein
LKSLSKATSTEAVDETAVVVDGEGGMVVEIIVLEVKARSPHLLSRGGKWLAEGAVVRALVVVKVAFSAAWVRRRVIFSLLFGIGGVCKLFIGVFGGAVALGSTLSTNLTALVSFPVGAVAIVVKR